MLIRFTAENYKAISGLVELNLTPSSSVRRLSHHISPVRSHGLKTLRGAVIYGANASGKSNLCEAVDFVRFLIKNSLPKQGTKLVPFDDKKDSRLEYEIAINDKAYAFGMVLNKKLIKEEWLYEISNDNENLIYKKFMDIEGASIVEFDPSIITDINSEDELYLRFIHRSTPENGLLLSQFFEKFEKRDSKLHNAISNVYDWFADTLEIITPDSKYMNFESDIIESENCNTFYSTFLKAFDTGIDCITSIKHKKQDLPNKVIENIDFILENEEEGEYIVHNNGSRYSIKINDQGELLDVSEVIFKASNNSNKKFYTLDELSDGTKRLIDIVPALFAAIYSGKVLFIDEIDRSLHPLITKILIEYFYSSDVKPLGQLIVTTHESRLMDQDYLRKDEIWFVQKEHDSSSLLYSLDDYVLRNDKSLINDYLDGRFGAVLDYKKSKACLMELINNA
ncbi:AAA family ATPase [Aliivibrio fischeri]|uniref:AAA family ATPase n=1 Tax=Aliivibrio fischeri TaxID=668 RepID=UPI0012D9D9B6|nr:ATP-binding protein [Aliivibrio fischeri]MUH97359.1 AAA family ATPase [Aliivibrio fischeri]MUI64972.1 AAA family ATPase [Aliivibrio fischeri]